MPKTISQPKKKSMIKQPALSEWYNSVLGDSHGIDSWADYATAYQKAYGLPTIDITTHSGFVEV